MIGDIWTIIWKEAKEILLQRGNLRGGWFGLLIFVGVFGIFMPLQSGPSWVESPIVSTWRSVTRAPATSTGKPWMLSPPT